ncbi:pyruvate kinase [Nannocystis pusilla]|uniref:pyruvate kinase n=1 Tax=Nannocystis pusilla TaxID=889268 RepID=UPI003B7AAE73
MLSVDPEAKVESGRVAIDYPHLAGEVKPGDRILMDDGALEVRVTGVEGTDIKTQVVTGGLLTSRKGVNLPGVHLSLPSMTEKDKEDLRFALELGVDLVAISFVRQPEDVLAVRTMMEEYGRVVPIVAKIEKPEAVTNLKSILEVSNGIMIARGDLGVEIGPEEVPVIQKQGIELANRVGKLVITATQMLDSMIRNPRPTRAEASDVANAVLDGSDAVMLSGGQPRARTRCRPCTRWTRSSARSNARSATGGSRPTSTSATRPTRSPAPPWSAASRCPTPRRS